METTVTIAEPEELDVGVTMQDTQEEVDIDLPGGMTFIQLPKHYIPSVSQVDAKTMTISFVPSHEGMEAVEAVTISLPAGPKGDPAVIKTDDTLKVSAEGVLSVNTADAPEADNTRPITAAAVHTTVGNIEVLLATI